MEHELAAIRGGVVRWRDLLHDVGVHSSAGVLDPITLRELHHIYLIPLDR